MVSGRRATSVQFLLPLCGSSFPESAEQGSWRPKGHGPWTVSAPSGRMGEGFAVFVLRRYSSLWLSFSVGKLLVKSKLDPLYVMAEFDGRAQFQVHTLLNSGQGEEQQSLPINFLGKHKIQVIDDVRWWVRQSLFFTLALLKSVHHFLLQTKNHTLPFDRLA